MSDFVMQIGADLDLSKVQEQLDSIKKQKVTLDVEIKGNDDAHNLAKSIEKGLKSTKIDTSGLSKQLADAFNITDKSAIGKIKSQINSVMSELGKTWNGKEFNLQGGKGNAFVSGLSDLANSVSQNANIIQGKMGIYDQFYSYFKDKKIYVSDDLKKALSGDEYKELLNNNIGHIVREASKGVSIDSIWGEMTSMFPEHFADNITSSNMEEMTTAINDAVKNAGLSTAGTINAISSILRHYGLSDSEISQSGLTNITGYASGTDYVNKSGIYRVNEKGMESVFSKQYGTLTFLNQGDKVFDANFTKSLLDNATIATQKNMPDYAGMAKAIEKNIQNIQNLSGNTYVNNFYIDGAQDTESILREIDKHLDKKIQAHDKKQVRDFRSLH